MRNGAARKAINRCDRELDVAVSLIRSQAAATFRDRVKRGSGVSGAGPKSGVQCCSRRDADSIIGLSLLSQARPEPAKAEEEYRGSECDAMRVPFYFRKEKLPYELTYEVHYMYVHFPLATEGSCLQSANRGPLQVWGLVRVIRDIFGVGHETGRFDRWTALSLLFKTPQTPTLRVAQKEETT